MKGAIVTQRGTITHETEIRTAEFTRPPELIRALAKMIHTLHAQGGHEVKGAGVGIPGPTDSRHGMVFTTPNLPIKKPLNMVKALQGKVRLPVVVQNDANCAALAESTWGAAKKSRVAVLITLGTGVGGGIVVDGKIFDGAFGLGAELGHMPLFPDARQRSAAGQGTLESFVKKEALKLLAQKKLGLRKSVSLIDVENHARGGDRRAQAVWDEAGRYLGIACAGIINILNPDTILFGGGISAAFSLFKKSLLEEASQRTFSSMFKSVVFARAQLGNEAGKLGAAQMILSAYEKRNLSKRT